MEDGRECLNIHNVKNRSDFPPKYEELQNVLLIRKYVNQPVMEDTANQNQRKHSSFLKKENANNPVTALPPPPRLQPQNSFIMDKWTPRKKSFPCQVDGLVLRFFYSGILRSFKRITRTLQISGNTLVLKLQLGNGESAVVKGMAAFPENLGSSPSTHMEVQSSQVQFQGT